MKFDKAVIESTILEMVDATDTMLEEAMQLDDGFDKDSALVKLYASCFTPVMLLPTPVTMKIAFQIAFLAGYKSGRAVTANTVLDNMLKDNPTK